VKACVLFEPGPPENLEVVEVRDPGPPGEGELLVKVEASGIDGHDTVTRSGVLRRGLHLKEMEVKENGSWTTKAGHILGHEMAGTVLAVGPGVTAFKTGDRVTNNVKAACRKCWYCLHGRSNLCKNGRGAEGGYAELAIIPAGACMVLPDNVSSENACFVSCAVGTPWRGVLKGEPRFTDTILVFGAGGGLGIHALQIVAPAGRRILAATTSPTKVPLFKEYGATDVVCAPDGKFAEEVMRITDGHGADLIIDTVGGTTFNNGGFRSLAEYGRYVFVGQINGEFAHFAVPFLFWREAILTGVSSPDYNDMTAGMAEISAGRIRPVVGATCTLEETPQMHARLEKNGVFGRAVITF